MENSIIEWKRLNFHPKASPFLSHKKYATTKNDNQLNQFKDCDMHYYSWNSFSDKTM